MEISQGELSQILRPYITRFKKHLPDLDKETGGREKRQWLIGQVREAFDERAIHDLTEDRFREIFREFYAVYGISRPSKDENRDEFLSLLINEGFQPFKEKLIDLIYGPEPFESRYSTFIQTTPNVGSAITSELLCYTDPERFAILNGPATRALWITDLNKYLTTPKRGGESGEYYIQFTELAQRIMELLQKEPEFGDTDLALVDYFLFAVSKTHFWQISPGKQGKYWEKSPVWQERGIVSVDYHELVANLHEDLLRINSKNKLLEEYKKTHPEESNGACQKQTGMLHNFLNIVEIGDLVVANRGKNAILGYGRIVSEPKIDESLEYPLFREVEWIETDLNLPIPDELKGKFNQTIVYLKIDEFKALIQKNGSERPIRYWNVHPTSRDGKRNLLEFWDEWKQGGTVTIGWAEIARKYGDKILECNDYDSFLTAYKNIYGDDRGPKTLWHFLRDMNEGDTIIVNRGQKTIVGQGVITSPARIDPDADYPFHRTVNWEAFSSEIPIPLNLKDNFRLIVRELSESEYRDIMTPIAAPNPLFEPIHHVLKYKNQVILYGPPGTGKTWVAKNYIKDFEKDPAVQEGAAEPFKRSCFVTFHQSFSYEEFVEGLRPSSDDKGNICYSVHEGIFKTFCRNAFNALMIEAGLSTVWDEGDTMPLLTVNERQQVTGVQENVPYFLIIDEINRGDISRIFGELITLLETDKRLFAEQELVVTLPYSKTSFGIPPNLRIIGTMNTADKSISLVDVALRRRFGFIEMMPQTAVLEEHLQSGNESTQEIFDLSIRLLERVNQQIISLYDRDHQIGHSYLMKLKGATSRDDAVEKLWFVWYYEILPLLQEYFYDSPRKMKEILGDFVDVENHSFMFREPLHDEAFVSSCRRLALSEHGEESGEELDQIP
ncbi:AAA domain [anaerobic digester metagenome]